MMHCHTIAKHKRIYKYVANNSSIDTHTYICTYIQRQHTSTYVTDHGVLFQHAVLKRFRLQLPGLQGFYFLFQSAPADLLHHQSRLALLHQAATQTTMYNKTNAMTTSGYSSTNNGTKDRKE